MSEPTVRTGRARQRDQALMRRAIELAERGWGRVAPNPLVGAVVASDGEISGEGFHAEYGQQHAEVTALREAGDACRGATLYVTLEPCTHHGKTPPCVPAIIERGIARVVIACRDPNPQARGGIERLRAAGIEVEVGIEEAEAARANAAFLWSQRTGRPFVTLKMALSLDARIAARTGERTAISGPEAGRWVQRLRSGQQGILVGRVTAEVDDPMLTVRGETPRQPPVRLVLDPELRLPPVSRLATTVEQAPVWVIAGEGAPRDRSAVLEGVGVRVLEVGRSAPHRLDLEQVLETLGREGVTSLLVEGGGQVAASFVSADMVQRMILIYAPRVIGAAGVPAFGAGVVPPGRWALAASRVLGGDVLLELEPATAAGGLIGNTGEE